jgi:hypothetical protein
MEEQTTSYPWHEAIAAMPVPMPVMRLVDPMQIVHRKRPQTMSASHIFDTNDPLQEPSPKRRHVPRFLYWLQVQKDDLWTLWRDLDQDGRRIT